MGEVRRFIVPVRTDTRLSTRGGRLLRLVPAQHRAPRVIVFLASELLELAGRFHAVPLPVKFVGVLNKEVRQIR